MNLLPTLIARDSRLLTLFESSSRRMVLLASDLLLTKGLDPISKSILSAIVWLDRFGAWDWNLRFVAVCTAAFLWCVRLAFKKKRGIDWYALLHAMVSAYGAIACFYLEFFAAEKLTGTPEPLRSVLCQGPLTSLHRILPAITMGYSLFDLLDGLTLSIDFVLHGAATLAGMAFFIEADLPHLLAPFLLMEVSTLNLTIVRADFFTPLVSALNQAVFALNFFLFRILLVPIMWVKLINVMWQTMDTVEYKSCIPAYLFPACFVIGIFFHSLNAYWFVKIVKKVRRKLSGNEGITANNDLTEEGDKKSN